MKLFKKANKVAVDFCERCGAVCDSACRSAAIRDGARAAALARGLRIA